MKTNRELHYVPGNFDLSKDRLIVKLKNASPHFEDLVNSLKLKPGNSLTAADYYSVRAGIKRFLFIYDDLKQDYSSVRELLCELDCILN
ncbi:hypothetical protein SD961_05610 [Erwinia sp. MMLR14_017]|uniref:hypothetical protein n=1 Tax=Erwinia sp. MMLR14_017 TaxID=3093842 RepID=UPI002990785E|nr:hypothetical protein [Erwinia sp. MMLR14_017]MDW8845377.1 hypothetical protein [Erwinia sp. MMLR14_017]